MWSLFHGPLLGAAQLQAGAADQTITGALFTDADTFFGSTVSASYAITGALYSDADTFFGATVSTSYGVTGALYTDPDTFFAATVTQIVDQTITGALYTDPDTFFGAVISQPGAVLPDTGGSGNRSGSGRRRNINDDPDAFTELLKEWRAKKERQDTDSPELPKTARDDGIEGAAIPPLVVGALDSLELQEQIRRFEAAFDRSMVAYEAALVRIERAKAAKAQETALMAENQARQQAMQLAIEWELARLAYEAFIEDEDEIMLLSAA